MRGRIVLVALISVACVLVSRPSGAASYEQMRADALARCRAVSPSEYQTGLAFNPDGYRSFYVRSECFQQAAALFRDDTLCREVKQRRTLLWSSWGYSPERCRELVKEGLEADRRALEEMKRRYVHGGIKLRDFAVQRNGNGRDFDILPSFTGEYAHGYALSFDILDQGPAPISLYSDGSYLDATSNLRLFVRQNELRQRFPTLTLNRSYQVRASVTLDVGNGGPSGYWSPGFIDMIFPARDRTHSVTKAITF